MILAVPWGCAKPSAAGRERGPMGCRFPSPVWAVVLAFVGTAVTVALSATPAAETPPLFRIQKNGQYGFIDRAGALVIPPRFALAEYFSEGLAIAKVRHLDEEVFINPRGEVAIPAWFLPRGKTAPRWCFRFSEGLAPAAVLKNQPVLRRELLKSYHWGYINTKGETVIEPRFDTAMPFSEGLAAVLVTDKWGYADKEGRFAIEPKFHDAMPFVAAAQDFHDGLARAFDHAKGQWGYIDHSGAYVIPPKFSGGLTQQCGDFSEGRAWVRWVRHIGYIDTKGQFAVEAKFSQGLDFHEGVAAVRIDAKWYYIGRAGKVVLEPPCEEAGDFSEGLAPVRIGPKWGYIDRTGQVVIQPTFDAARPFRNGLAEVGLGPLMERKIGYINHKGTCVWEPTQ